MALTSKAASSASQRSGTSAPSPSAPSFRFGPSALTSSLSAIPGAKLMTPGGRSVTSATSGTSAPSRNPERIREAASSRPVTRPAPVVVARLVAPAELPRVRRREDQPVMAQIVEETASPHRRPPGPRAHNNTSASQSTQGQAGQARAARAGQSERNLGRSSIRVSASLVQAGNNSSESGRQPRRPARGTDNASSARAQPNTASAAAQLDLPRALLLRTGSNSSEPTRQARDVGRAALPSGASPSSAGLGLVRASASTAVHGVQTWPARRLVKAPGQHGQGCRDCMDRFSLWLYGTSRTWAFACAVFAALLGGVIALVLASLRCGACWRWTGMLSSDE